MAVYLSKYDNIEILVHMNWIEFLGAFNGRGGAIYHILAIFSQRKSSNFIKLFHTQYKNSQWQWLESIDPIIP